MGTVLVAAMDQAVVDVLSTELESEGHRVLLASEGNEAYEVVLRAQPDLVFVEPNLPVFNGYELSAMLRGDPEVAATLPVVLLVGDDVNVRGMEQAGVTDTLGQRHELWEVRDLLVEHLGPEALG